MYAASWCLGVFSLLVLFCSVRLFLAPCACFRLATSRMCLSLPWLQCGRRINYRQVIPVGESCRRCDLCSCHKLNVLCGLGNDSAYKAFLEEHDAPKQKVSMWGAPLTVGYVLVRRGATDKIMVNVHVQLNRRSFQLSATMLSGARFWQDTFFYSQQIVASQISMYCRTILLNINMMQLTPELVLVGRNGVIDR